MGGKASSEFNFLPLVVPGWLEQLPIPPGRRSRRTSEEQGPINMKSILRYINIYLDTSKMSLMVPYHKDPSYTIQSDEAKITKD